ncbi:hypothetical protein FHS42_002527 [Streptomyces zagrosensis]|uniref:Uncharacterized protein n=1 Tax=Streptomyces zagrosensis TaxID=1042984 RepID=A0A7W9Q8A8_9ACTN|nr:hypothetical protein [Streptomyces zagrosensis]
MSLPQHICLSVSVCTVPSTMRHPAVAAGDALFDNAPLLFSPYLTVRR